MSRTTADYSIAAHTVSDIGCVRKSNQDAVAYIVPRLAVDRRRLGVLLIVADGMGGHQGGEVASELAVQTIAESYFAATDEDRRQAAGLHDRLEVGVPDRRAHGPHLTIGADSDEGAHRRRATAARG